MLRVLQLAFATLRAHEGEVGLPVQDLRAKGQLRPSCALSSVFECAFVVSARIGQHSGGGALHNLTQVALDAFPKQTRALLAALARRTPTGRGGARARGSSLGGTGLDLRLGLGRLRCRLALPGQEAFGNLKPDVKAQGLPCAMETFRSRNDP